MTHPVTIRGKQYPSMVAAAQDLGVTPQAISAARRLNKLDTVGLELGGSHLSKKFKVGNHEFRSLREASKFLDLPVAYLTGYIRTSEVLARIEKGAN